MLSAPISKNGSSNWDRDRVNAKVMKDKRADDGSQVDAFRRQAHVLGRLQSSGRIVELTSKDSVKVSDVYAKPPRSGPRQAVVTTRK
jgi:hypothetical protein